MSLSINHAAPRPGQGGLHLEMVDRGPLFCGHDVRDPGLEELVGPLRKGIVHRLR